MNSKFTSAVGAFVLSILLATTSAQSQVTFNVINNFAESIGGTYFGGHIENPDIALYFTGIGGSDVTYNSGVDTATAGERRFVGFWGSFAGGGSSCCGNVRAAGKHPHPR